MANEEQPNVYEVPKGYDSKILIKGIIAIKTLLLWIAIVIVGVQVTEHLMINGLLKIITIVFHMIMGVVLLTPRISHPDRPTYKVLFYILLERDKNRYSSIDINKYRKK